MTANVPPHSMAHSIDDMMWPLRGWFALVPPSVAVRQLRWERGRAILRARHAGATLAEIGAKMGLSVGRVEQLQAEARERPVAPVTQWLATPVVVESTISFASIVFGGPPP